MNVARHLFTALAVTVIAGSATVSYACDKDKATASTAAKKVRASAVVASMDGAACTPEMMAACKAKKTSATAVTAANMADHCASAKATAVTASAGDHCATTKSTAKATAAVTAAAGDDCCMKGAATTAAKSARATKGMRISASAVEGKCGGTGMAGIANRSLGCEAGADMSLCSDALDAAGAHRQMVRLKNGVMLVYTADSPGKVNAVQTAVNSRGERLIRFAAAAERAGLCTDCKAIHSALASGRLNREVVNIEGGSLMLLTSSDAATVVRIHAMTDLKVAARIKS